MVKLSVKHHVSEEYGYQCQGAAAYSTPFEVRLSYLKRYAIITDCFLAPFVRN